MPTSIFELYSIGIGPSSSHTLGPLRAAYAFIKKLQAQKSLTKTTEIKAEFFGSLGLTGEGHGSDKAIILGLAGKKANEIDPKEIDPFLTHVEKEKKLFLLGKHPISFEKEKSILFYKDRKLPLHANAMRFSAFLKGEELFSEVYYSIGGGFILTHEEMKVRRDTKSFVPHPFYTAKELLQICKKEKKSIEEIVLANEKVNHTEIQVRSYVFSLWKEMKLAIERGCQTKGTLPGKIGLVRRAPHLYESLMKENSKNPCFMEWVSVFAMAVCEENAAMGKVVTSPTNGAAGIIPAVLTYYEKFIPSFCVEGVVSYFLTSTAIGHLFRVGASIAGAEMGCQGETGVASSMAAAGLTAALGGSIYQIENAAEIAMEHHLGLTCDPIAGLVQVPCIERNTMGAVKAILASKLALKGDGKHFVSLDQVIQTMKKVGEDMKSEYKETSLGGLAKFAAPHIPQC